MVGAIDVVADDAVVVEAEDVETEMTVVVEGNTVGVVVDDDVDDATAVVDDVNITVVGTIMIKRMQITIKINPPILS